MTEIQNSTVEYKKKKKPWWYKAETPEVGDTPWLHPEVIAFIDSILTPESRVLEFGGGGSTIWFAKRVAEVVTVESDFAWYEKIQEKIPDNVKLVYHAGAGIPTMRRLQLSDKGRFDFLLIDGEPIINRSAWINSAPLLVAPGGIIALDNANRPEYSAEYNRLLERSAWRKIFDCNTPDTQYLLTAFFQMVAPNAKKEKRQL